MQPGLIVPIRAKRHTDDGGMFMGEKKGYFETALSDFMFDVAAGGAIRHLADRGHSIEQIMGELDYPVPRARVEKAFYRYLSETGILLPVLPDESIKSWHRFVRGKNGMDSAKMLTCHIEEYGETNAYMECPFGKWIGAYEKEGTKYMSCLSSREREYILGIRWEQHVMYHRLNGRIREIGIKLLMHTDWTWDFYFRGQ